jgi:hypothetical protein
VYGGVLPRLLVMDVSSQGVDLNMECGLLNPPTLILPKLGIPRS